MANERLLSTLVTPKGTKVEKFLCDETPKVIKKVVTLSEEHPLKKAGVDYFVKKGEQFCAVGNDNFVLAGNWLNSKERNLSEVRKFIEVIKNLPSGFKISR